METKEQSKNELKEKRDFNTGAKMSDDKRKTKKMFSKYDKINFFGMYNISSNQKLSVDVNENKILCVLIREH